MTNEDPDRVSGSWTVERAKAQFDEVIDRARSKGPQTITRGGRLEALVVAPDDWERRAQKVGTLAFFFAASPLREVPDLLIARQHEFSRKFDM